MHFTHYQKAGDKVFAVNPHPIRFEQFNTDGSFKTYTLNETYDNFQTWQSTQQPIYADPSIKDGVMYKVEELEIVWQRFAYGTWLDCYEELTEEQMFNSRLYARLKQPVKQEEKYHVCHICQKQGLRHCSEADRCDGVKSYPKQLRELIELEYGKNTPLSIIAEMAFDLGKNI